ncbi:MAG: ABA4-like family protein [Litorimonas sp.]
MDLGFWFSNMSNFAMIGWLFLAFYPRRKAWLFKLTGLIMPALMGIVYAAFFIPNLVGTPGAGYNSLEQVQALMSNPALLLAGWIHYLAFDLAVGTYIAKQSDKIGLARIIQIPVLFLTFMFGPIGLMTFVLIKSTRKISEPIFGNLIKKGETA